ncbi:uncharacterized protein B0P05DRAFT_468813 [Gilbertella persicaria]|uniref:uncharacterized protein n=1 Tax=Gilbertella persicaria TaxID=101096 RepID=UPI002220168C|nr:uncharacterized protein B0P05DRAFT_468813 [Gilbertella persicaria]KAI8080759.1 hypothetical protein B0P05DRAFT_468813 [Gilbertella persicaria]
METSPENPPAALFDTTDIILLSAIGLGTLAWFTRHQIADLLFGKKQQASLTNAPTTPKREKNFVKVMEQQGRRVIVFYGSQTGTAEGYAARLAKECSQRFGVSCMTADLELYDLTYLDQVPEDKLVIFLLATYGEGDPTDNAVEFWDLLTEEEPMFSEGNERLSNLKYVMFGLGNKTYEQYNAVSRRIDQQLLKLGAKRIGEAGEGDDDGSLEEDFLAWKETMWPAFCNALGVDESSARSGPREPIYAVEELAHYEKGDVYFGELAERTKSGAKIAYDAKRPYIAPITTRELFHGTDRHCLHVEVDVSNTNLSYTTGDHLAIWPTNNESEVNRLAAVLGLTDKLDTVVMVKAIDPTAPKKHPFPVPTTYRSMFRHYMEICAPVSRQVLNSFVEYAPSEESKGFLTQLATDKEKYRIYVGDACRNLGEVLQLVTGHDTKPGLFSQVPFDLIVETIARMQPRFYSISSSSKESPKRITATIVTLSYEPTPERTVYGVNSNFLYNIQASHHGIASEGPTYDLAGPRQAYLGPDGHCCRIPVHVRHSQFKLPRNPTVPVIMIGPGTGVAPFRGFVRERVVDKRNGKPVGTTLLFYGSRHASQDFLYADEWPQLFEELGGDSRIVTAFSRDQPQKIYVQHRLQEQAAHIWSLLQKGGYIYVCGDAKNMARDVNQTFVACATQIGGLTLAQAQDYVKGLRTTGRYQEDVWS